MSADRIRRALFQTINALVRAQEVRDAYTVGHQGNVSALSRLVAHAMGLSPEQIEGVRVAGLLHDIGKLAIPSELLAKPTKLTALERELINTHPTVGCHILSGIDFPWPIAQAVLQHHERWDGSGYPSGLKAEEIILEARIVAVCDVYDSMNSHRPYRPALGKEKARAELRDNAGKLYDPAAVAACLKVTE